MLSCRRSSLLFMVAALMCWSGLGLQAQTVVTSIRIKSLNKLAGDIDTVGGHLGLPPSGRSAVMALAGVAGSGTGSDYIDMDKPAFAYVLLHNSSGTSAGMGFGMTPPALVVVAPMLGDGSALEEGLKAAYTGHARQGELVQYSLPAAQSAGLKPQVWIGKEGGYAIMGNDAAATEKILGRFREKIPPEPDATVSATVGIQSLLPMLESAVAMGKMATAGMPPTDGGAGAPINTAAIVGAELDMLLAFCRQVATFNLRLSAAQTHVELTTYVTLEPNSLLARIQAGLQPVSDRFKALVPDDAYLALAANGAQIYSDFGAELTTLMGPVMAAMGQGIDATTWEEQMKLMEGLFSGDVSVAFVPSTGPIGFGLMEFLAIKDPAKVQEAMLKGVMMGVPGGTAAGMEVSIEENDRQYQDVSISRITYTMTSLDTTPQLKGLMDAFTSSEFATVGDVMVVALGGSGIMDRAIDLARGGGKLAVDRTPHFLSLFPLAEGQNITAMSMHPAKLSGAIMKSTMAAVGLPMTLTMPDTKGGVAYRSYMAGDKHIGVLHVAYSELEALKALGGLGVKGRSRTQTMDVDAYETEENSAAGQDPVSECVNNLRMIDAAKELCAMENGLADGAAIPEGGLMKFLPGGITPGCPLGSSYGIGLVGEAPSCQTEGHKLP